MKKTLILYVVGIIMLLAGIASATSLVPDSEIKNIPIGGTVDFTLTLNPSYTETGSLEWQTFDAPITARINNVGTFALSGSYGPFSVTKLVSKTFILTVAADSNAVVGQQYDVEVDYLNTVSVIKARATTTVDPVPELSTSILTITGLVGLVLLINTRRRN
jgi:hypothetical protein